MLLQFSNMSTGLNPSSSEPCTTNVRQHVEEPTHRTGHTLDLLITRNVDISELFVRDNRISDHYSVYFTATPASKDPKTEEDKDQDEQAKRFKERRNRNSG